MSWDYAENNERRGPVEEGTFAALVASGVVKGETLVWREGMDNWQPYSAVRPPAAATEPGPGLVQCSSCDGYFPESDVITIAGRTVCAGCKPRVVQQMLEGTTGDGATIDPAKLLADLRARGGLPGCRWAVCSDERGVW